MTTLTRVETKFESIKRKLSAYTVIIFAEIYLKQFN